MFKVREHVPRGVEEKHEEPQDSRKHSLYLPVTGYRSANQLRMPNN